MFSLGCTKVRLFDENANIIMGIIAKKVAEMFGGVGNFLYLCSVIKKEKNL